MASPNCRCSRLKNDSTRGPNQVQVSESAAARRLAGISVFCVICWKQVVIDADAAEARPIDQGGPSLGDLQSSVLRWLADESPVGPRSACLAALDRKAYGAEMRELRRMIRTLRKEQ